MIRQLVDKPENIEAHELNTVIEYKQEQQKYFKLPYMQRGHTMYEINPVTQMVDAAKLSEGTVHFMDRNKKVEKHIVANPGCIYISALNETNAIKRYAKVQKAKFKK